MNNQSERIEEAFTRIENINSDSERVILDAINNVIQEIDNGNLRVAEQINDHWIVNEYAKKAILLYFCVKKNIFKKSRNWQLKSPNDLHSTKH